jgi:large subunit ribosomal protein L7/L12
MSEEEKKTEEKAEAKEESKPEEEKPIVEPKEEKEGEEVKIPKEFKTLIDQIEKMSVMELNELVKVLEKKFGVSAQAVAVPAPGAGAEGDAGAEEQDSFTVELKDPGGQKIAIIKVVKEVLGLGLKEAKDLIDGAPSVLKEGVKKEEAEEIKKKIEEAGGAAELK